MIRQDGRPKRVDDVRVTDAKVERERAWLESLYAQFHDRRYLGTDPIEFAGSELGVADREITALVCALLSYGNVRAIRRTVQEVRRVLGNRPRDYVLSRRRASMARDFAGFRYRFTSEDDLVGLLWGVRRVIADHGSIEACFAHHLAEDDATTVGALGGFVSEVQARSGRGLLHLLAHPERGSACKRMHLYLRWMVRRDLIDAGGWSAIGPGQLVVPLDTHVHRLALARGWTKRRQGNGVTALEVTAFLRRVCAGDPLRYDFCMTRPGIMARLGGGNVG